jgi:HEPN superfamily Apea-like protein/ApeA-like protein
MARQRIETGSAFEFDSFWRAADGSDGVEDAQGRLTYDPAKGIELAVVDLRTVRPDVFESSGVIPVLHGHDLQGKPCTLFDAIATETEGGLFGGHVREVLTSNRLVHGAQLRSMDDLEVGDVLVDLWGLTEWVNGIWEDQESAEPEGNLRLSRLRKRLAVLWPSRRKAEPTVELPDGEVLNVPLDGAHLILQRGLATREGRRTLNRREAHVTAHFVLEQATTYQDFTERFVRPLQDLMVLTRRSRSEVDAITVLMPREEQKWWDGEPLRVAETVGIIERTRTDRPAGPGHARPQIPMPLRAWGGSAPALLAAWFRLRHELGGPANLLFATLNKRDVSLEDDVLNLLSVAEGYHRLRLNQPPFADEEHDEVLSLIRTIDDGARRNHYLVRLRYANEQSQKQRVKALFERAEKVLPEVESWRRKQLQALIDTRNFLTHWGEPTDDVLEDWDLWFALNRVRVVLEVNLYLDLGIDRRTISRAVNVAYHGREFMGPA